MGIRVATPADGAALFDIYGYYIENSTATFEITQITPEIMENRIADTLRDFPYLVWEENGVILGYCYAHRLGEREAFQFGAELCIYLHPQCVGGGVGSQLYCKLMALLSRQGICNGYASITSENEGSIRFHHRHGFQSVGCIPRAGYKFGRWLDLCWLSKPLNLTKMPGKVIPFIELDTIEVQSILKREDG